MVLRHIGLDHHLGAEILGREVQPNPHVGQRMACPQSRQSKTDAYPFRFRNKSAVLRAASRSTIASTRGADKISPGVSRKFMIRTGGRFCMSECRAIAARFPVE